MRWFHISVRGGVGKETQRETETEAGSMSRNVSLKTLPAFCRGVSIILGHLYTDREKGLRIKF